MFHFLTQRAKRQLHEGRVLDCYRIDRVFPGSQLHEIATAVDAEGRLVLLKCLRPRQTNLRTQAALAEEGLLLMELKHPQIRPCVRILQEPLTQVLDYIDGISLHTLIKASQAKGHGVPPGHAFEIASQLITVLHFLHAQKIVHRDLVPENILLERRSGRVVLIDFNISSWPHRRFPLHAYAKAAIYNCPESWEAQAPTPAWDIYQIGIVLFQMLSGAPPRFSRRPSRHRILPEVVIKLPLALKSLSAEVEQLLCGMTARTPSHRPVANRHLCDRLSHYARLWTPGESH